MDIPDALIGTVEVARVQGPLLDEHLELLILTLETIFGDDLAAMGGIDGTLIFYRKTPHQGG